MSIKKWTDYCMALIEYRGVEMAGLMNDNLDIITGLYHNIGFPECAPGDEEGSMTMAWNFDNHILILDVFDKSNKIDVFIKNKVNNRYSGVENINLNEVRSSVLRMKEKIK